MVWHTVSFPLLSSQSCIIQYKGTHMALQMSIGFLFMGGGRASLSRSKESIAALLAACFPRFPKSIDDNQYHLQPLRHLWVMAVSWRGLKAVDADTGKDVVVPLLVELNACVDYTAETAHVPATKRRIVTPCLLPPLKDISCVCINSERYYPNKWAIPRSAAVY